MNKPTNPLTSKYAIGGISVKSSTIHREGECLTFDGIAKNFLPKDIDRIAEAQYAFLIAEITSENMQSKMTIHTWTIMSPIDSGYRIVIEFQLLPVNSEAVTEQYLLFMSTMFYEFTAKLCEQEIFNDRLCSLVSLDQKDLDFCDYFAKRTIRQNNLLSGKAISSATILTPMGEHPFWNKVRSVSPRAATRKTDNKPVIGLITGISNISRKEMTFTVDTTDCSVIDGNSVRLLLCEEPFLEWSNQCFTALMNAEKLVFNYDSVTNNPDEPSKVIHIVTQTYKLHSENHLPIFSSR